MTGSKSGFGGLILGLFLLDIILPGMKNKIIYILSTIFALIFSFIIGGLLTTGDLSTTRVAAVEAAFSFETRFEWWSKGFKSLSENYGLGLGIGGFRKLISPVKFAHNIFLSTLFDLGIIGFSFFVLLLVYVFYELARLMRKPLDSRVKAILCCMVASFAGYLLNNILQGEYYNRVFLLMLGLYISIIKVFETSFNAKRLTVKTLGVNKNIPLSNR